MARIPRPNELLKKPNADTVINRGAEGSKDEGGERVTVNVYLPKKALPVVDQAASRMGMPRSAWVRLAILEKLRRDGEPDW